MSGDLAVRAALVLGVGVVAGRLLNGAPAAARYRVHRLTVLLTLALPLLSVVSPAWGVVTTPHIAASSARPQVPARGEGQAWFALLQPAHVSAIASGGSVVVGIYFAVGYLRLVRIRRRAQPAPASWLDASARLSARIRLQRAPSVLVSAECAGPWVTGLIHPAILIPPAAADWTATRREAVLLHELAHIQRGDLLTQLAAQSVVALHWFNPLTWAVLGAMRRDRERACDDAVVRAGFTPRAYAEELLAIATADARSPMPALSMARVSELEGRLRALLAGRTRRAGGWSVRLASLMVLSASVAIAGAAHTRADAPAPSWSNAEPGMLLPLPHDEPAGMSVAADSADPAVRERATTALAFASGAHVVPALLDALSAPEPGVREKAAVGLSWRRDARIGPALVKAAADPDPDVREKVLVALAFSSAPEAGQIISAARTDPDAGVRDKAQKLSILR